MTLQLKAYIDLKICPKGRFQLQPISRKLKQSAVCPSKILKKRHLEKFSSYTSNFKHSTRKAK